MLACLLARSELQPFDLVETTMATVNSQAYLSNERHFKLFRVQQCAAHKRLSNWTRPLNMPAHLDVGILTRRILLMGAPR